MFNSCEAWKDHKTELDLRVERVVVDSPSKRFILYFNPLLSLNVILDMIMKIWWENTEIKKHYIHCNLWESKIKGKKSNKEQEEVDEDGDEGNRIWIVTILGYILNAIKGIEPLILLVTHGNYSAQNTFILFFRVTLAFLLFLVLFHLNIPLINIFLVISRAIR